MQLLETRQALNYEKGWFWWMSSERSKAVNELQAQLAIAEREFDKVAVQREKLRQAAFGVVGLWSEYGVGEARQLFWDCLEKGKGFARRATFWDALFGLTMGRDENIGSFLFRVAM